MPNSETILLEVFDITGKRILSQSKTLDTGLNQLDLDLKNIPVSILILKLRFADSMLVKTIKM